MNSVRRKFDGEQGSAVLKGMKYAMDVSKSELIGKNRVIDRPNLLASFEELNDLMGLKQPDLPEQGFAS